MSATALIVVVPEAEPLVGAVRLRHDESARLGAPAHITVLFRFHSVCRAVVLMENSSGRWRRMREFALAPQQRR